LSIAGAFIIVCTNVAATLAKYRAAKIAAESLKQGKEYRELPGSEVPCQEACGA